MADKELTAWFIYRGWKDGITWTTKGDGDVPLNINDDDMMTRLAIATRFHIQDAFREPGIVLSSEGWPKDEPAMIVILDMDEDKAWASWMSGSYIQDTIEFTPTGDDAEKEWNESIFLYDWLEGVADDD